MPFSLLTQKFSISTYQASDIFHFDTGFVHISSFIESLIQLIDNLIYGIKILQRYRYLVRDT
jgi:hypothetical protein